MQYLVQTDMVTAFMLVRQIEYIRSVVDLIKIKMTGARVKLVESGELSGIQEQSHIFHYPDSVYILYYRPSFWFIVKINSWYCISYYLLFGCYNIKSFFN